MVPGVVSEPPQEAPETGRGCGGGVREAESLPSCLPPNCKLSPGPTGHTLQAWWQAGDSLHPSTFKACFLRSWGTFGLLLFFLFG